MRQVVMTEQLSRIFERTFGHCLGQKLQRYNSSVDHAQVYVTGHLLWLLIAPTELNRLLFTNRRATFVSALPDTGAENQSVIDVWSANGFYLVAMDSSSGIGTVRCCFCSCICQIQPWFDADYEAVLRLHTESALSKGTHCSVVSLLSIQVADPAGIAAQARRIAGDMRKLRLALELLPVQLASSYGYSTNLLCLSIARHLYSIKLIGPDSDGALPSLRAGDIIALAQNMEQFYYYSEFDILGLIDLALVDQPPISSNQLVQQSVVSVTPMGSGAAIVATAAAAAAAPSGPDATDDTNVDDEKCSRCRMRTRNRVSLPCAHFVSCERCLELSGACLRCHGVVLASLVAYIT
ncbi:hypothetical protein BOX15_Mlig014917g1 [Macrostomum lignano]|uniref:RING-type domain-containing protein n=2 Tax=Macrostomum lignano TaxID=282301 RepID=A0A1I8IM96_9PLAT|nr:hypothetical protein BOX15_Mlig014917g1 [Macrostomum lignano]